MVLRLVLFAIAVLCTIDAIAAKSGSEGRGYSAPRAYKTPTYSAPQYKAPVYKPQPAYKHPSAPRAYKPPKDPAAIRAPRPPRADRIKPAPPLRESKSSGIGARPVTSRIRVHDGDTFYADGKRYRVRGIDTPELGAARSFAAKERLERLLAGGAVTIESRGRDKHGRTVAIVRVNGEDVSEVLRREGFAK